MSFLSKIFKKKEGGTFVGNIIRKVVGGATSGALGNGAMLETPGETPAEYNSRMIQAAAAAAAAAQATALSVQGNASNSVQQNITAGFGLETVKQYGGYIIAGVAGLGLIIYLIFKRK